MRSGKAISGVDHSVVGDREYAGNSAMYWNFALDDSFLIDNAEHEPCRVIDDILSRWADRDSGGRVFTEKVMVGAVYITQHVTGGISVILRGSDRKK